MAEETIVAVFDTAAHADAAVQALRAADVPASAISQHSDPADTSTTTTTTAAPVREQGFWKSLFGGEPGDGGDAAVYDRSLSSGSTVVTVRSPEQHAPAVLDILERHSPVDIDDRAASYGVAPPAATHDAPVVAAAPRASATGTAVAAKDGETIPLAEETLSVGKRAVNRGTTRVRRYVVETPVHEQVSLRDETVSVERRPVADGRPVTGADFTDRVVEVNEAGEEAVVSKTARVREEVVIRKDATERTETVNDTVRREDVEITKDGGAERGTPAPAAAADRPVRGKL